MPFRTWTLADHDQDIYVEQLMLTPETVGGPTGGYSVSKRTLRTGLSQGVDVIEVRHGDFHFVVVPTRGMGIWKAGLGDLQLGWKSPVRGPVHPAFVPLGHPSGLGWLEGFDELLVRCGLENFGAPEFLPDGRLQYGLHGKIGNLPAHKVEVAIDGDTGRIAVRGAVDEARLFGRKLRLETSIETTVGRPSIIVRDTVRNLSAAASDFALGYHVNFGSPLLNPGAKVHVPAKRIAPYNALAAAELKSWNVYDPETPRSAEVCYTFEPAADAEGNTQAVLHNRAATQGVSLKFNARQLPCFTLWKNREAAADGYVTGLEPGTGYPNLRSFEEEVGRIVELAPGEARQFDLEIVPLADAAAVRAATAEADSLQRGVQPEMLAQPDPRMSCRT